MQSLLLGGKVPTGITWLALLLHVTVLTGVAPTRAGLAHSALTVLGWMNQPNKIKVRSPLDCIFMSLSSISFFVAVVQHLSHAWSFVTPWTVSHQAPLYMGFPSQEYWNRLPFPSSGNLPRSGFESMFLSLADEFLYHWATSHFRGVQESESESHSAGSDSFWSHGLCNPWNSPG